MINRNIFYKKKNYNKYILFILIFSSIFFLLDNNTNEISFKRNIYISFISNKIKNYFNNIKKIYKYNIYNKKYNNKIKNKIYNLKKKIIKYKIEINKNNFYKIENENFKKLLNIEIIKKNNFIISKVLYNDNNNTIIVINKGKNDKIYLGQPVINEDGIIGQVINVNKKTSIVLTILNNKNPIISKIARNNIQLILYKHPYYYNMLYVKKKFLLHMNIKNIKENDLLISTGLDNKYPEGYPIGKIFKIFNSKKKIILVKPTSNFKKLNYVALIC